MEIADSLRGLENALRRACADAALVRAAGGVRMCMSDLMAAAPPMPVVDSRPTDLDMGILLDPLADSALATAAPDLAAAPAGISEFPADHHASFPVAPRTARAPASLPKSAGGGRDATRATNTSLPVDSTPAAVRVATLLARHPNLGAGDVAVMKRDSDRAQRTPRKVVPLPLRRLNPPAGGPARVAAPDRGSRELVSGIGAPPRLLARWNQAAVSGDATGFPSDERAASEMRAARHRADRDRGNASSPLPAPVRPTPDVPLRLNDLVRVAAATGSRPGTAPQPEAETASPAALAAAAPTGGLMGRVMEALGRIEMQTGARAATAGVVPQHVDPQWLDEDDDLAGRIQDILRRQAQRHGIDTP